MKYGIYIFGSLASLMHVLFFMLESVLWMKPPVRKIFKMTVEDAGVCRVMALNQGFYNLFLALGLLVGLVLFYQGKTSSGAALLAFGGMCMFGAALVLVVSTGVLRGALLQGIPPLLLLEFVSFSI